MFKKFAKYTAIFIAFILWDYIASVEVIYLASRSSWAILFAALTTGIGIFGFYAMLDGQRKIIAPLVIISAALGAWLSITWS